MANTGFTIAGTGASVDRAGNNAWSNPSRITSDDASYSTSSEQTDYLVASNFGFSLPEATIDGIVVRVKAAEFFGDVEITAQLHSDTTPTLIGTTKGPTAITTTPTNYDFGGAADLWGATLNTSTINSSGFGVSVWSASTGGDSVAVDAVWIDVYFTQTGGSGKFSGKLGGKLTGKFG